jgi:hypothetical protein
MAVRGGKRAGSGRKPKADEIKLIERIDATVTPKELIEKAWDLAKAGDIQALKLLFNYRFGMPQQKIDHTTEGRKINLPPYMDAGKS